MSTGRSFRASLNGKPPFPRLTVLARFPAALSFMVNGFGEVRLNGDREVHGRDAVMRRSFWVRSCSVVLTALLLAGCQQGDDDDADVPNFSVSRAPSAEPPKKDVASTSDIELVGRKEPPREGSLKFTLKPGAKFPLQKTVEQSLAQQTKDGKLMSKSRLFTRFAITVDAEEAGKRRLSVRYDRVRYSHDLLGDKVEYDSANPSEQVPDAALLYHGMVNNGFSFWLSDDNRVIDVEGMPEFLQRCARFIPAQRRQQALEQVMSSSEDESFANFLDDSIGLLRFNKDAPGREFFIKEGDEWKRSRKLTTPVGMVLDTTYRLAQLGDKTAKIDVYGTIVPMRVMTLTPAGQPKSESEMYLKEGHTAGVCTIDRESGLPIFSRVERNLSLRVRIPNAGDFDQHKRVMTTIESFPSGQPIYTGQDDRPQHGAQDILPTSATKPASDGLDELPPPPTTRRGRPAESRSSNSDFTPPRVQ